MVEIEYDGIIYRVGDRVIRINRSFGNALVGSTYTIRAIVKGILGTYQLILNDDPTLYRYSIGNFRPLKRRGELIFNYVTSKDIYEYDGFKNWSKEFK